MTECCETCRFFRAPWSAEEDVGACRRFPPVVPCMEPVARGVNVAAPWAVEMRGGMLPGFPLALPESWCGEWRAADMEEEMNDADR